MEENQKFEGEVQVNALNDETPSAQEQEQAVLDQAVDQGDIAPESAGYETLDDGTLKIDLDAIQERETEEVPVGERAPDSQEVEQEVRVESDQEEQPTEDSSDGPLELIQDEVSEVSDGDAPQAQDEVLEEPVQTQPEVVLPEGVEKLVKFMDETGGTLEDYIKLNQDIDKLDPVSTLKEYYKQTKPYLTDDQINRQLNKKFHYTEEDDVDDIEDKKIAFQEELFKAKQSLSQQKEKYYADLKLGSKLPPEAQEALKFRNEQTETLQRQEAMKNEFLQKTNKVFNNEFKGFDFSVGENKYRVKVGDVGKVKEFQSDLNNFVGQFLNDEGTIADAAGYHKAMYAAQNADKLAQHFYEQGRADAIRHSAKEANNINMDPRKDASSVTTPSGQNIRVVSGDSMDKLKIRWNK